MKGKIDKKQLENEIIELTKDTVEIKDNIIKDLIEEDLKEFKNIRKFIIETFC